MLLNCFITNWNNKKTYLELYKTRLMVVKLRLVFSYPIFFLCLLRILATNIWQIKPILGVTDPGRRYFGCEKMAHFSLQKDIFVNEL